MLTTKLPYLCQHYSRSPICIPFQIFSNLIKIIENEDFFPEDVQDVQWGKINEMLGSQDKNVWIEGDATWTQSHAFISIPYSWPPKKVAHSH